MKYKIRISPSETDLVESLSEEYKGHFLFINHKGDLSIGNIDSGLIICDYNIIVFKYGKASYDNWKNHVDYAIQLTENNIQNTIDNSSSINHPCGIMNSNYAPFGKIQKILNEYKF